MAGGVSLERLQRPAPHFFPEQEEVPESGVHRRARTALYLDLWPTADELSSRERAARAAALARIAEPERQLRERLTRVTCRRAGAPRRS